MSDNQYLTLCRQFNVNKNIFEKTLITFDYGTSEGVPTLFHIFETTEDNCVGTLVTNV